MKTTLYAAIAALAIAFAPVAFAGESEGNGDPFAFHVGSIATTHFTNGVADQAPNPYVADTDPAYQQPVTAQSDDLPNAAQPARRG